MVLTTWWRQRRIRTRLTLWYSAAVVVVLAAYATAVFVFVEHSTFDALDNRLHGDFQWAAEMVDLRPDGSFAWFEGKNGDEEAPWLQVFTEGGDILYRSVTAERLRIVESARLASQHLNGVWSVRSAAGVRFRFMNAETTIAGQPVTIQVARAEAPVRRDLSRLSLILILGLPVGVVGAGLSGYLLARGALAPVDRMAEQARSITAEKLDARLPVHNPDDEIGRLASVFNETLARLEWSFAQMREFTATVSHELRTPLTAIRTVGEVGLREPRNDAGYRAIIGSMLEEADRLASLVDRLLMLSRAQTGQTSMCMERVRVDELVDEVVGYLAVIAEEKQQSVVVQCEATAEVCGDRVMLRQALVNILDNAIKYSPAGSRIRVRVVAAVAHVIVETIDAGPGIPADVRTRVFERYQRGAQPGEARGIGLGLAIARWAVHANGGTLTLESQPGAGSTFRIILPAFVGVPAPATQAVEAGVTSPKLVASEGLIPG